jgi:hypothetical protein
MAKKTRQLICHWEEETGSYVLLNVPANSAHITKHKLDVPATAGACPVVEEEVAEVDAEAPVDSAEHV